MNLQPQIIIDPKEELEIVLRVIYYKPGGLYKSFDKLAKASSNAGYNFKYPDICAWLFKQALYQIYSPQPGYIPQPSYNNVRRPNALHFADIVYMPWDKVKGKVYKYALSIVDCASRYKWRYPLTEKTAKHAAKAFKKVYSDPNIPLIWPWVIQVDQGTEFLGICKATLKKHKVRIRVVYTHRSQGMVEGFNGTSADRSFRGQHANELASGGISRSWVDNNTDILIAMNNEKTRLLGMKPADAIKLRRTPKAKASLPACRPIGREEKILDINSKVRHLLLPEDLPGHKRRVTDPNWTLAVFNIDRIIVEDEKPVLYYLKKGPNSDDRPPKRSFVREELFNVPPDTETPPHII